MMMESAPSVTPKGSRVHPRMRTDKVDIQFFFLVERGCEGV